MKQSGFTAALAAATLGALAITQAANAQSSPPQSSSSQSGKAAILILDPTLGAMGGRLPKTVAGVVRKNDIFRSPENPSVRDVMIAMRSIRHHQ